MMKKLIELAAGAFGRAAGGAKEIQYRYIYLLPECGAGLSAVCVG